MRRKKNGKSLEIEMLEEITKMEEEVSLKSCASPTDHFVLVHGINGGAWCWYKIRCLMENSGYKVSTVDLKSAGIDPSDADSVLSFDDYNKPLLDFLSSLPEDEQVRRRNQLICVLFAIMDLKWDYFSAGGIGGAQRRRVERDPGDAEVSEEDSAGGLCCGHNAQAWAL